MPPNRAASIAWVRQQAVATARRRGSSAPPAPPDVAFVGATANHGGSASASIAVPATATSGRLGLMIVSCTGNGAFTPPTGWTLVRAQRWYFDGRDTRLYRKVFGASESGNYVTTVPFSNWGVGLIVLENADATTPVEASNSGNIGNFATSFATGNVTAGGAGRVLVGIWAASANGEVVTVPGTMTSRLAFTGGGSAGQFLYVGTEAAGAGTYGRTGTTPASDDYAAYLVTVQPSTS